MFLKGSVALSFHQLSFFLFFPITLLIVFAVPARFQNGVLLAASWLFYAFATPQWLVLLIAESVAVWALTLWMDKAQGKQRKLRLFLLCAATVGVLIACKASGLALQSTTGFSLILPLGISFFTLQSASYAIDVYRQTCPAEKSFVRTALFVSFFCVISSGPILRAGSFLPQLNKPRRFRADRAAHALVTLGQGYLYKVAIADVLAVFVNGVYADVFSYQGLTLAAAALGYGFQLYFDFVGYSLLAMGFAELLGLELPVNFNTPYFSRSIKEFWSRWHISLSSWLRDYVYIPLGGNRRGTARKCLNLLITFFVSGLWHGTGVCFLIWGLLHGLYQVCGTLTTPARARFRTALHITEQNKLWNVVQCLFTFLLVQVAWVFFRSATPAEALYILSAPFQSLSVSALWNDFFQIYNASLQTAILVYAAAAFIVLSVFLGVVLESLRRFACKGIDLSGWILQRSFLVRWVIYYVLCGIIFGGFLLNNGYFATAANFLYNNF